VRFDLSPVTDALANGATITGATLRLRFYSTAGGSNTLQVMRFADANAGWVEGTATSAVEQVGTSSFANKIEGSPLGSTANDVAWVGGLGAKGTGGYFTTPLGSTSFSQGATGTLDVVLSDIPGSTLTQMLNTWAGGTNAGFYLKMANSVGETTEYQFHSREYTGGSPAQLILDVIPGN
jgi:hypothetical protein